MNGKENVQSRMEGNAKRDAGRFVENATGIFHLNFSAWTLVGIKLAKQAISKTNFIN